MAIILASQSPRRRELLQQMGLTDFKIIPAEGEEKMDSSLPPEELVQQLALQKAKQVAEKADPADVVIGADTIVVLDGKVLGKPANAAVAFQMLSSLSGRRHTVYTGVAIVQGEKEMVAYEGTQVRFCYLTEQEILDYIATGEPMDKAGAYGIQGRGALLVDSIQGDFYNVVGLPICRLGRMLAGFHIHCL
jgi:septum formation protein